MDDTTEPQHQADDRQPDPAFPATDGTTDTPRSPADSAAVARKERDPRLQAALRLQRVQGERMRAIAGVSTRPILQKMFQEQQQQIDQVRRAIKGPVHESIVKGAISPSSSVAEWAATQRRRDAELATSIAETAKRRAERDAAAHRADLAMLALLEEAREQRQALHEQGIALATVEQALGDLVELAEGQVEAQRQLVESQRQLVESQRQLLEAQRAASNETRHWNWRIYIAALAAVVVAVVGWLFPRSNSSLPPPGPTPTVTVPTPTTRPAPATTPTSVPRHRGR
jgi:hypothetical protein